MAEKKALVVYAAAYETVEAALAGLGIVALTRFDVKPHLESGALLQILPEWKRRTLPFYVVYPPNRHLSAKVRAFVDVLTRGGAMLPWEPSGCGGGAGPFTGQSIARRALVRPGRVDYSFGHGGDERGHEGGARAPRRE